MNFFKIFVVILFFTNFLYSKQQFKICTIKIKHAIIKEEQAKHVMKKFQKNNYKQRIILENKGSEIKNLQILINSNSLLDRETRGKKEKELNQKSIKFQQLYQKTQKLMEIEKIKILEDIEQKNNIIIRVVSIDQNCDITFDREFIHFFNKKIIFDITEKVISQFNKNYPANF